MKRVAIIAAVIAAISATPAFAASSASASLSNFTVTLTDLDLEDGITPSLTWLDTGYTQVYGQAFDPVNSNFQSFNQFDSFDFTPLSGAVATLQSQASAATTGTDFNTAGMQASGSALGNSANYISRAYGYGYFTLSAHTQANFSAAASAQVNTTVGGDGFGTEVANALFELRAQEGSNIVVDQFTSSVNYNYDSVTGFYSGQSASDVRLLSVLLSSSGTGGLSGYLSSRAFVGGYSDIQAVPEPETYAMLLAGLGLIGFTARRRIAVGLY